MHISPTLKQLLDDGVRHDAEYADGLSNHRPMALIALERLGADGARLRAWAGAYERQLAPARGADPWPAGDAWKSRLGDPAAWPAYRDLFRQWIVHEGAVDMLAQVLPGLMPGCGAAAFHGLIRTAYAVQVGHLGELADGLAHWAASFMPLGGLPVAEPTERDPIVLLRLLPAGSSRAPLIAGRMIAAARGGTVNRAIASLAIDRDTPQRLARAAAFAYAHSGNFTALHLVTGTHAMRVLARFLDDEETRQAAWRSFWQAYAHGVVAARLGAAAPATLRPWPEIVAAAIEADDEHVIKLVDSARQEEQVYVADGTGTEDLWRRAASRAVAPLLEVPGQART
jgi:hypothetical protein